MAIFISQIVRASIRFPWLTVAIFVILTVISGIYAARNIAINTDISNLISPDIDWRQREIDFEKAFPSRSETILAVVEAPTPELATQAANALTERLAPQKALFRSVRRLDGGEFFERNGLLFQPTAELGQTLGQAQELSPIITMLARNPNWMGLSQAGQGALGGVQANKITMEQLGPLFDQFSATIEREMAGQPASFSWQELLSQQKPQDSDLRRFIEVWPILDFTALEPGKTATDAIRQAAAELKLAETYQARVRLTGPVPISDEEFATVREGALVNGLGTVAVVLVILWFALKSARIIGAVFLSLTAGLAITAALGFWLVGSLNLISVAFFVLFVGLGVDFCIQVCVRYRDERHSIDDLKAALVEAGRKIGGPLSLAAAATAAGFLSFLPTKYQGVSELGLIAGFGMIIAFVTSVTLLPALLAILNPAGEQEPLGYKWLAPADRFLERNRKAVVFGTLAVVIAGLPLLYFLRFDFNPLNLRSAEVESIATFLDLRRDPNTGANSINILVRDPAEAAQLTEKLSALPEVRRVMTVDSLVPQDQETKLGLIQKFGPPLMEVLKTPPEDAPTDEEKLEFIEALANALQAMGEHFEGPGGESAKRLAAQLQAVAKAPEARRAEVEQVLTGPLRFTIAQFQDLLQPQPVSVESMPVELRESWNTADGRTRVEVFPTGDPNDNETLRVFADKVLAIAPQAIGGPVSILKSGDTIVLAFVQAGALAFLSITILLWLALRNVRDVFLTMLPLLVAGLVTMEICVLIGLQLNFANIIALPLLFGIGVAFKIYYVMAWRAGETEFLQSALTRAVFFSALTTATAFGSLWLSSHPGTSSMGKLLALSLVTTLAAAVLFQPALMGRPRDDAKPGTDPGGLG